MAQLVNAYDINGVLLNVYDEAFALRKGLQEGYFRGIDESEQILVDGIRSGHLYVDVAPGAVKRLSRDAKAGIESITMSTHPVPRQHAEFEAVGLEGAVSGYNAVYPKTMEYFLGFSAKLQEKGKQLNLFADNMEVNVYNAVRAAMALRGSDKHGFKVYLVDNNADADDLGETAHGFIVVRTLADIDHVEGKVSKYRAKHAGLRKLRTLHWQRKMKAKLAKKRRKRSRGSGKVA